MHNRRPPRPCWQVVASTIGPIEIGLLPALEGAFSGRAAVPVEHEALGTGAALDRAKRGGIDLVIAHAPALEQRFIADGWGLARHPVAANEFVLAGPAADPAGVLDASDVLAALRRIREADALFLTRGDRSGTHSKEHELWTAAGIQAEGAAWYRVAEAGMAGSARRPARQPPRGAYILLDRATYLTARPELVVLAEGDPRLLHVLCAMPVKPRRAADVNEGGAEAFLQWLLGSESQALIGDFGRAEHGTGLFLRRDEIPALDAT